MIQMLLNIKLVLNIIKITEDLLKIEGKKKKTKKRGGRGKIYHNIIRSIVTAKYTMQMICFWNQALYLTRAVYHIESIE